MKRLKHFPKGTYVRFEHNPIKPDTLGLVVEVDTSRYHYKVKWMRGGSGWYAGECFCYVSPLIVLAAQAIE